MLVFESLRKTFDGVVALDDFTATVGQGAASTDTMQGGERTMRSVKTIAIVGPNGAGKTTLLDVVTGFVRPDAGRCLLEGRDITGLPPYQVARAGFARMFQELRVLSRLTVLEHIMLAASTEEDCAFWRAVVRADLSSRERANRDRAMHLLTFAGLSDEANTLVDDLSYGQQKLVALASCIATGARWLLLDEPVSGLHPHLREQVVALLKDLREQGRHIIFIEHDMSAVQNAADRVLVMDEGRIVADGPPSEVLAQQKTLEAFVD